ncbi:MAG: response regulator [Candidatus Nitrosotenuis sp.]
MNILIAEDDRFTTSQYSRILQKYGHTITITKDGSECLRTYQKQLKRTEFDTLDANPFDLVILDQAMPEKSGSEVATEILSIKPTQKIIFTSTDVSNRTEQIKHPEDRVEYLQKPFSLNAFVQKIQG